MWTALIAPITSLLDKFIEDKDQKNKLAHEIATMAEKQAHEANMAQVETNQAEATHRSIWVAGWRPFYWLGMWYRFSLAFCIISCYTILSSMV